MGCQGSKTQASAPTVAKGQENREQNHVQTACGPDAVQEQPVPPNSKHAARPQHEEPVVLMQETGAQDKTGNDNQFVGVAEGHTDASCIALNQTPEAQDLAEATGPVDDKPAILTEQQATCLNLESASEDKEQVAATNAVNEVQEAAEMHVHESAGGAAHGGLLACQQHGSIDLPGIGTSDDKEVQQVRAAGMDCSKGDASACKLTSETAPEVLSENCVRVGSPQQVAPTWRSVFSCCAASTIA